ncbi:cytidine deaminase [Veillonella sp. R32]|uniref:cytidine deaminase n=1 Tax=Veillonella sp. R32 TaxID=2021312 RepID=UPI00138A1271|nr:cytidine deaminase [Veillonella sp. R32]KAF1681675.1 cytidine deaminase [Veillonella sp. R32]
MSELSTSLVEALLVAAKEAKQQSYSPYSHFAVGAALLCEDGTIFTGCNIENASYGLTNCAERVAIQSAVAAGQRSFQAIAIVGDSIGPCMPCGACRQVLAEFKVPMVHCETKSGVRSAYSLDELLPHSFGPDDL